jgi:hypothetical protein
MPELVRLAVRALGLLQLRGGCQPVALLEGIQCAALIGRGRRSGTGAVLRHEPPKLTQALLAPRRFTAPDVGFTIWRAVARGTVPMIPLGYGKFVRADRVFALVPLEGAERGDGRRTLVHVEGIEAPLVASRSEGAIARDVAVALGQGGARGRYEAAGIAGQEALF